MKFSTSALLLTIFLALTTLAPEASADLNDSAAAAVKGDTSKVFAQFRPLAEKGDAAAQFRLGWMFDRGDGVQQDFQQALHWYRLAAAQGHAMAQNNIGTFYEHGKGVANDYQEAIV